MIDRTPPKPRIALAHEALTTIGEAEYALDRIARIAVKRYEAEELYTLYGKKAAEQLKYLSRLEVIPSSLHRLPPGMPRPSSTLIPPAIDGLSSRLEASSAARAVWLLISSSWGYIKGMDAPEGARHLCYCHGLPEELWGLEPEEVAAVDVGARTGKGRDKLRAWDKRSVVNVEAFIASSHATARAIQQVYGRDARVIHPPARTKLFNPDPDVKREDFYLLVGPLEARRNPELAVEAAMLAGKRLIVAGDGPRRGAVRTHAKKTAKRLAKLGWAAGRDALVDIVGEPHEEQLVGLYRRARALLMPWRASFGLEAAEAQACGCPVVALRAGGACDIVLEGRTGTFFNEPTAEAMVEAMGKCPGNVDDQCRANAERFSEIRFDREMVKVIEELIGR